MKKVSWYLSIWFICLWFIFSFFFVLFFIGLILLLFRVREEKKIQKYWEESGFSNIVDVKREQERIEEEIMNKQKDATKEKEQTKKEIDKLQTKADKDLEKTNERKLNVEALLEKTLVEVEQKQEEIIILDDELLYQSFGFYDTKYDLEDSEQYKLKLTEIKKQQKEMVKSKIATDHFDEWQERKSTRLNSSHVA